MINGLCQNLDGPPSSGHSFDFFERLLETQIFFFEKLPPGTAKTVFENPGVPLLDVEKKILQIKFLSKPCEGIWSHDSKMV